MRELFDQVVWREHILTLIQLGGSLLLLVFSMVYYFNEKDELNIAQADLDAQIYANDEAEASSYILKDYLEEFRQLQLGGKIGEPRRLQWLETLRIIGEDNRIPGLEFTLEGSEIIRQNVDPFWTTDVQIKATDMKVTMQLSHEGDLFRILDGLSQQAPGLFNVEECSLRWLKDINDDLALTRLRGDCDLRWYSVDDVTKAWQETTL